MSVKLLIEHHLVFRSLKGGRIDLSKSTLVKMPHCWKSHVAAHFSTDPPIKCNCSIVVNIQISLGPGMKFNLVRKKRS